MAQYIITGSYTSDAMKGMIANPSDREKAAAALTAAAGGKMESFFLTTGDSDFIMRVSTDDLPKMLSALMVAGASGRGLQSQDRAMLHLGRVHGGAEGRRRHRREIQPAQLRGGSEGRGTAPAPFALQ